MGIFLLRQLHGISLTLPSFLLYMCVEFPPYSILPFYRPKQLYSLTNKINTYTKKDFPHQKQSRSILSHMTTCFIISPSNSEEILISIPPYTTGLQPYILLRKGDSQFVFVCTPPGVIPENQFCISPGWIKKGQIIQYFEHKGSIQRISTHHRDMEQQGDG